MSRLFFALLLTILWQSCIAVSVDKIDAVNGFDWDTLKRDLIVMTPVMDLRPSAVTPPGFEQDVAPLSSKQATDYAEAFKKVFFKYRKDIRVFGAGGAFENIAKIPELPVIARKVLAKETLSLTEQNLLNSARQDKRFIFFFNFTEERLEYDYSVASPSEAKGLYVEKNYDAKRIMTFKLALWDSEAAQTVYIAEKTLTPFFRNQVLIKTGLSPFGVKGDKGRYASAREPDIYDLNSFQSLNDELRVHSARFPNKFPGREPEFTDSFKSFVLKLPIKKSEQNLLEYEYFVFHRPELAFRTSSLGEKPMNSFFVGTSSIIYKRYRWGAGVDFSGSNGYLNYAQKEYQIERAIFCLTTDLEWELASNLRMMTGSLLGAGNFKILSKDELLIDSEDAKKRGKNDGFWYAAPRIKFLLGPKEGLQFGLGVYRQHYSGVIEPQLIANKPSPWGGEFSVSLTFRGF